MSDSEDEAGLEDGKKIDKEQLRRIEENDHKTSKADKKKKRLENIGIKEEQSGSEFEEEKEDDEDKKDGKDAKGKKEEIFPDHKPLKEDRELVKKSLFLGEKFGHFKLGTYMRIEVKINKKISR